MQQMKQKKIYRNCWQNIGYIFLTFDKSIQDLDAEDKKEFDRETQS